MYILPISVVFYVKKETFFVLFFFKLVNCTFQDSTRRPKVEFSIPKCYVKFVSCLALKVGTAHFYDECEQMLPQSSCQVALFLLTVHVAQPVMNTFYCQAISMPYAVKPPRCVGNHRRLCVQSLEVVTG